MKTVLLVMFVIIMGCGCATQKPLCTDVSKLKITEVRQHLNNIQRNME